MSVEIVLRLNGAAVPVVLDDAALAVIASALADRAPASEASPWLYGARRASQYTGLPLGAIQKATAACAIPCHRLGRRVAYRRDELDGWLSEGGDGPA